jgi:phospholipid/cholesterol/gamma-HCH transport system substrate-binding protein
MSNRSLEIAVGLFVTLGVIALLVLAVKVSGLSQFSFYENNYALTADFENIGGLKPRAKVSIGGVHVGRVKSIELNQQAVNQGLLFSARVQLLIDDHVKLPQDTQADILTAGLLGDNYIGLSPGFSEQLLSPDGHIAIENTNSAIVLEELISKFTSTKASGF